MRRLIVFVGALAAGCFGPRSQVNPGDAIIASGQVERQSASPLVGASVQLIRHPDPLQLLGEVFQGVATLGLACLTGNLDICKPFESATTGAGGAFQFAFRGSDTQGSTGEALLFTAFATGPLPGTAVSADFYAQRTRIIMPTLELWEVQGAETDVAATQTVDFVWPSTDGTIGVAADEYTLVVSSSGGQTVWTQSAGTSTGAAIDQRVTQDFAGSWSAWAHRRVIGDGTDWNLTWYSVPAAYASKNLVPRSRGKDCYAQSAAGAVKLVGCPLTDGNLSTGYTPQAPATCPTNMPSCAKPPVNNWIYFDLGQPTPLSLLVLYDVAITSGAITVEGSDDAQTWSLISAATGAAYQRVPLAV